MRRTRTIRLLMIPALLAPVVVGSLALSGTAFAKSKGPKPATVNCTNLGGNTGTSVTVSGCSPSAATGGSGVFTVFQIVSETSSGNVVTWANGATATYSLSATPILNDQKKDKCPGGDTASGPIEVKLTGSVTSQTIPANLSATDGGVKPAIKATLCVATTAQGFAPTLLKGTWKF